MYFKRKYTLKNSLRVDPLPNSKMHNLTTDIQISGTKNIEITRISTFS